MKKRRGQRSKFSKSFEKLPKPQIIEEDGKRYKREADE